MPCSRASRAPWLRLTAVTAALAAGFACGLPDDYRSAWRAQLEPDSPCYEVNLLDGLSVESTAELHALFACVNQRGQWEPLAPVVDSLDQPTDTGGVVGVAIATALDALSAAELDVWGLAGIAVDALRDARELVEPVIDLTLEGITGRPASAVRAGQVDPTDSALLAAAPISRSTPVLLGLIDSLRDRPDLLPRVADLLTSPETARWLDTVGVYAASNRPAVRRPVHALAGDLGEALLAVTDTTNDRWPDAGGNSLQDLLLLTLVGGEAPPLIDAFAQDLLIVGTDARIRERLPDTLLSLHTAGHLAAVPERIAWMASINRQGRPVGGDDPSALAALLRMLHAANRPFRCEVRVLGVGISADLGNLAVEILDLLSRQDAEFLVSTSSILSDVLGAPLSDTVIEAVVDSGVCPTLTAELVDDIGAVEVLKRPEAYPLLVAFIDVLDLLRRGETSHLDRLADVASLLHQRGAVPPFEDLVRDLGPQPLLRDVMDLVPALVDPAASGLATESGVIVFDDVIGLAVDLVSPRTDGVSGTTWSAWSPLIGPLLRKASTWALADALGALLRQPDATAHDAISVVPDLLALDPDLAFADAAAVILRDERVSTPVLAALAEGSLLRAALATTPAVAEQPVPQAFFVQLVTDGTLDSALHLLDLVLSALEDPE
jgi:hypothetical protein